MSHPRYTPTSRGVEETLTVPKGALRRSKLLVRNSSATLGPSWMDRLGEVELKRRLWHMLPGLLPLLLWPIPHSDPISPMLISIILAVSLPIALAIFVRYRMIARSAEDNNQLQAVAGYAGSVLATILLFPSALEIGLAVLAVLSFGDGSATLFGRALGGRPLPWNSAKTDTGLYAGFLCGGVMATLIYFQEANPGVPLSIALIIGFGMATAGCLVESVRSRINDNIRVGVTAAITGVLLHHLLVGFPSI